MGKKSLYIIGISILTQLSAISWAEDCFLSTAEVIKQTLQNQWSVQLSEQETLVQQGLLQQAAGAFDTQINADYTRNYQVDLQSPLGEKSDFVGKSTETNVNIQKLSRIGTLYTLTYRNVNIVNPFLINLEPPRTDSTLIAFTVNQPLLRNLYYSPQTTLEKAQYMSYESSLFQNVQNIANAVATTLTSYWQVVGNLKILEATILQEEELKKLEQFAIRLVDEDQQGSASLYQPEAAVANAVVNRLQAEQDVRTAYNNLMYAMGRVPLCEDEDTYKYVKFEPFPSLENLALLDECCFQNYLSLIPIKRMDIIAFHLLEDVAALNLQSAMNGLLPEINLIGRAGLMNTNGGRRNSGLFESFPFQSNPEKDFTVGVTVNYPLCNDFAKGLVRQNRALLFQSQINTSQLQGQIVRDFKIAFTLNNNLVKQLAESHKETIASRKAWEVEIVKLSIGLSSWFDVLGLASDAIAAQIQEYNLEILFLQNLIQLHLLVGDLVNWDGHINCMEIADFKQFLCTNNNQGCGLSSDASKLPEGEEEKPKTKGDDGSQE